MHREDDPKCKSCGCYLNVASILAGYKLCSTHRAAAFVPDKPGEDVGDFPDEDISVTEEAKAALLANANHVQTCKCNGTAIEDEDGEAKCISCGRYVEVPVA